MSITQELTYLLCAGKLAPCCHQQARLQRGTDDGPGRSGRPEDPSLVLYSEPETELRGGGPGGGDQHGDGRPWKHRGGLLLPPSVHRRLLWGEEFECNQISLKISLFTFHDQMIIHLHNFWCFSNQIIVFIKLVRLQADVAKRSTNTTEGLACSRMFMSWVWTKLGMNPAYIGSDIAKKKRLIFSCLKFAQVWRWTRKRYG